LSSRSVRSWVVSVEAWPSRRRTARGHARRLLMAWREAES
jgi:hypothetical protein